MKKLIAFIQNTLAKLWGGVLQFVIERGETAVKVTNIIKSVVESQALSFIVLATPTKGDDVLLAKAKVLAPKIVLQVGLAMNIITEIDEAEDEIQAASRILEYVKTYIPEKGHGIFYREFTGELIEALADGQVSGPEAFALGQLVFKKILSLKNG